MRYKSLTWMLVPLIFGSPSLQAFGAEQTSVILSPPLAAAIRAAQTAVTHRHWHEAAENLNRAHALESSDHERYLVDELAAYVLFERHMTSEAAAAYAALLRSPYGSALRLRRFKVVAQLYFKAGQYGEAASYGARYLHLQPHDAGMTALVADSYLRIGNFRDSTRTIEPAISRVEAEHQVPQENWLRIAQNAYHAVGDLCSETLVSTKLVRYYHRPEDWRTLLALTRGETRDEHLQLAYLRLRFELGLLNDPGQYESLIFESLQAKMPGKAKEVLAQAERRGVFPQERLERLKHAMRRRQYDLHAELLHAQNRAQTDATGESYARVGRIFLGQARYPQAIAALQSAISRGLLHHPQEVQTDLGIALLRDHQVDSAREAFSAVTAGTDWARLSKLWSLRLDTEMSAANS